MKTSSIILLVLLFASTAAAYENSTMTDSYRRVVYGDPIGGVMWLLNELMPNGWVHILFLALFYLMLWLTQDSIVMPNALLLIALVLYGVFLPTIVMQVIFILVVFAITMTLMKFYSPVWHK